MRIAIIGMGIVGQAVARGTQHREFLCTFDRYKEAMTQNWGKYPETELCFVCVPTPTTKGYQDLTELESTMKLLRSYKGVVCVKSTVLPKTMNRLREVNPNLRLVHFPEFLTEKNAAADYKNQKFAMISGKIEDTSIVMKYCDKNLNLDRMAVFTDYRVTEWAKYMHNCMLAVELSFLNECFNLMDDAELYSKAAGVAQAFGNVGPLHKIPGPDGKRGWGGMCFPKDTKALAAMGIEAKKMMPTLMGAITTNAILRPEVMLEGKKK
jgi:UDPglucose 6-dehydrogenase